MSYSFADRTIRELVREQQARTRLFEELGIDYCCGGDRPLKVACEVAGLNLEDVSRRLEDWDANQLFKAGESTDWTTSPLSLLADHIVETHHAYLRRELPRLAGLIDRVVNAHGQNHPEQAEVRRVFESLCQELVSHTMKEERILFPIIKQLEQAKAQSSEAPAFHCGSVSNPIAVMEQEHDNAGEALQRLRELTSNYTTPPDACETYRAEIAGLRELELDLHRHIHKENNILFPRAIEMEAALQPSS